MVGRPSPRRNAILSAETRQKMSDRRLLYYAKRARPPELPPENKAAPFCACGCGIPVSWRGGFGWNRFCPGHHLPAIDPNTTSAKQSATMQAHFAGIRNRDIDPTGPGVYATKEYLEARKALVENMPCKHCGRTDQIHAHHAIPGDDASLVPLCSSCHVIEHRTMGHEYVGRLPPAGQKPPLCGCGCGHPVRWKRVRGWAKFCKGHGVAKIPAGTCNQAAPLCQCGCGEPTKYRFGKGWNAYKRGHSQRVEGHYSTKPKTSAP